MGLPSTLQKRRRLSKEAEQNLEMLQNILDTVDLGIWSYDYTAGAMLFVSLGLTKITGYPREVFINRDSWVGIIHPDDLEIFEQLSLNLRLGLSDTSEYRIIDADGQIRWVQNRIITKLEGGAMIRLHGVVLDISRVSKLRAGADPK